MERRDKVTTSIEKRANVKNCEADGLTADEKIETENGAAIGVMSGGTININNNKTSGGTE